MGPLRNALRSFFFTRGAFASLYFLIHIFPTYLSLTISASIKGAPQHCTCQSSLPLHSSKILTIQLGYPCEVSSIGKPRPTLTGISSVSICRVYLSEWLIKSLLTGQVHVHVGWGNPCWRNKYFLLQTTKVSSDRVFFGKSTRHFQHAERTRFALLFNRKIFRLYM